MTVQTFYPVMIVVIINHVIGSKMQPFMASNEKHITMAGQSYSTFFMQYTTLCTMFGIVLIYFVQWEQNNEMYSNEWFMTVAVTMAYFIDLNF